MPLSYNLKQLRWYEEYQRPMNFPMQSTGAAVTIGPKPVKCISCTKTIRYQYGPSAGAICEECARNATRLIERSYEAYVIDDFDTLLRGFADRKVDNPATALLAAVKEAKERPELGEFCP